MKVRWHRVAFVAILSSLLTMVAVRCKADSGVDGDLAPTWELLNPPSSRGCINVSGHYENRGEPSPSNNEHRLSTFSAMLGRRFEIVRRRDIDNILLKQNDGQELTVIYRVGPKEVAIQSVGAQDGTVTCTAHKLVLRQPYEVRATEHSHAAKGVITYEFYRATDGALVLKHHYLGVARDYQFSGSEESVDWYRFSVIGD